MNLKERLESVRARIEAAAQKSGRSAADITLIAVTKGVSAEKIIDAQAAGIVICGENKIQEAEPKTLLVPPPVEWHMVGHLQSNKVKAAVSLFQMIQSVDSVRIAKAISAEAAAAQKKVPVLLEVNISGEAQKYGFKPEEIYSALEEIAALPNLKVSGLMGIAPFGATSEAVRDSFKKLKSVFSVCRGLKRANIEMKHLSMGMSDDFEIAIEEGSNMVRLGRALFGDRKR